MRRKWMLGKLEFIIQQKEFRINRRNSPFNEDNCNFLF